MMFKVFINNEMCYNSVSRYLALEQVLTVDNQYLTLQKIALSKKLEQDTIRVKVSISRDSMRRLGRVARLPPPIPCFP